MSTIERHTVRIDEIPHIDADPPYERIDGGDGFPWIRLPSGHTAVNLTRYDDVRAVLADSTAGRTALNTPDGASFLPTITPPEVLINLDQPVHGRMRQVIRRDFSAQGIAEIQPLIERTAVERIEALRAGGSEGDLLAEVFDRVPAAVDARLLGVSEEAFRARRHLGEQIQIADREDVEGLVASFEQLYGWCYQLVAGAEERSDDGLVARYVRDHKHGEEPITDADLVGIVLGIVLGADHNIVTMLTKTTFIALAAPSIWERLAEQPELVPAFVEEALRLMPLGTNGTFPRLLTRELETSHGTLPPGAIVYPNVVQANRDPLHYAEPDAIDLDREPRRHLQFGYGMHHCMGAALARAELTTTLGELVRRVPTLRLAVEPEEVPWVFGTGLRRPTSLPLTW